MERGLTRRVINVNSSLLLLHLISEVVDLLLDGDYYCLITCARDPLGCSGGNTSLTNCSWHRLESCGASLASQSPSLTVRLPDKEAPSTVFMCTTKPAPPLDHAFIPPSPLSTIYQTHTAHIGHHPMYCCLVKAPCQPFLPLSSQPLSTTFFISLEYYFLFDSTSSAHREIAFPLHNRQ